MKRIPRIGFFVLVTLLSSTSATFPAEETVKESLSTTIFSTSQLLAQAQDVRKAKAEQLQQQGIKQLNEGQFEEALKSLQQSLIIYQEIEALQEEGQTLKHLGNVYYSLENYTQALEYQRQAFKIAKTIGDRDLEWRTLNNIGLNYYWQSDYPKALNYYQQSLAISQAIENPEGQALTLGNLGDVYHEQENYSQAIESYQNSLTLANDPSFEKAISMRLVWTYGELALSNETDGNYQQAAKYYKISLSQAQELKDAKAKAIASKGIQRIQKIIEATAKAEQILQQGIKQLNQGLKDAAKQTFQQALDLYFEIGNFQGGLQALDRIGNTYQLIGEFTQAIETLEYQLVLSQKLGNLPLLSSSLAQLQGIYLQQKDYPKSIEYGQLLLQFVQNIKNNQLEGENHRELENLRIETEALALNMIIMAYELDGDLSKAIEYSKKNLAIAQESNDDLRKAEINYNLGGIYGELNNYIEAINHLDESQNIAQEINNPLLQARSLQSLGMLYFRLGDFEQAKEKAIKALDLIDEINNSQKNKQSLSKSEEDYLNQSHLEILTLLGNVSLWGFGDTDQAYEKYQQTLHLAQKTQLPLYEGIATNSLGLIYGLQGEYQQAIDNLEQGWKIAREHASQFELIENNIKAAELSTLAYAYGSLGKNQEKNGNIKEAEKSFQTAIEYAQKSLAIAEEFETSVIDKANPLYVLGRNYFLIGNLKESEKYLRESISIFEDVGTKLRLEDSKQVFFSDTYVDEYELLQQVLIAQDRFVEALEVAEQARARGFVELLAKRLSPNPIKEPTITPPTIKQIKKIAQEQNATLVNYSIIHDPSKFLMPSKIQGKGQNSESELFIWVIKPTGEVAFRRVNVQDVLSDKENISQEKLTSNYQLAKIFISPWITATTVVTLVCFIGLGVWRFQWLQSLAKVLQYQIKDHPSKFWLSVLLVAALSGSLVYRGLSNQPTTTEDVSKTYTLIGKAVTHTNPPNSDRQLKKLYQLLINPIADLLPAESEERVIFIPQGSLFYLPFPALQSPSEDYFIERHTILTAPSIQVLDLTKQLQQRLQANDLITTQTQDILVVGNPTMPKKSNGEKWPALESSEEAAKAIAALLNTQALIGSQATEDTVSQRMENAKIIHLGTHGEADNNRGFGSWIILAPSDKNDGYLTAEEILKLNLNAELVVLSACETGLGRLTGDGLVGLSRSFIQAGTPSLVISLWSVGDTQTKDLMIQFYRELQKNPDKAQALRQAMLVTREKYPEPKYWAAFTLIGEAE